MSTIHEIDQLSSYAQPIAGPTHAAFQNIAHAKLPADLLDVDGAPFLGEARIACDYTLPNQFGRSDLPSDGNWRSRKDDLVVS